MRMFFCQSIRISYTLQLKTHIVLQDLTRVVEEAESEGMEVDLWWAQVAEATLGGEKKFPILSRLALALCTICNSSSEVERDFSDMEAV